MKKLVLAILVLAFCSLSFAATKSTATVNNQEETAALSAQRSAAVGTQHSVFSTANCSFTFASGARNTFLKYCVTANGNVTVFESPQGVEHIAAGEIGEGYGLCDMTSNVAYNDYAEFGDSGNWGPATVLSQTSKSVKIARTTSDGAWTLTQTFTQVTGAPPLLTIAMTLKNNTNVVRQALLMRYADVDAASVFQNNLDATADRAFGWNSVGGNAPFGLVLQDGGNTFADSVLNPFIQDVPDGPRPCSIGDHAVAGPVTATDGSLVMSYHFDVGQGESGTVTVSYRSY